MRGVFSHAQPQSESKPKHIYKVGHSIKLHTTQDLLNADITQQLFDLVLPLSQLPEDYFEACYKKLIEGFAAYVNVLPKDLQSGLGSLYCSSLYGAYHTLKQFVADKPEADCLWRFALFSVALLKKANAPAQNYQVIITDPEGHFIERWNPFDKSLQDAGAKYCKLYDNNHLFVHNYAILIGMCIQQIVPEAAMRWLQTDGDLFAQWLDCLQSEYDTAGVLGEGLEPLNDEEEIFNYEERIPVELIETPETAPGEILDQWIREAIANGDLKVNTPDAHVHIVKDGLSDAMFVDPGVIRDFARKMANSPLSTAAAVAQFHAIFGPSQQHALALAMPGLTRRNSLMSGGSAGGTQQKVLNALRVDAGRYFGKDKIPAKSDYASQAKTNESLTKLESIIKGNDASATNKSSFSTRRF